MATDAASARLRSPHRHLRTAGHPVQCPRRHRSRCRQNSWLPCAASGGIDTHVMPPRAATMHDPGKEFGIAKPPRPYRPDPRSGAAAGRGVTRSASHWSSAHSPCGNYLAPNRFATNPAWKVASSSIRSVTRPLRFHRERQEPLRVQQQVDARIVPLAVDAGGVLRWKTSCAPRAASRHDPTFARRGWMGCRL